MQNNKVKLNKTRDFYTEKHGEKNATRFRPPIFLPSRALHFIWNPTNNGCYCFRPCHYIYKICYRFMFILEPWNVHLNGSSTAHPHTISFLLVNRWLVLHIDEVESKRFHLFLSIGLFQKIDKTHFQCFCFLVDGWY